MFVEEVVGRRPDPEQLAKLAPQPALLGGVEVAVAEVRVLGPAAVDEHELQAPRCLRAPGARHRRRVRRARRLAMMSERLKREMAQLERERSGQRTSERTSLSLLIFLGSRRISSTSSTRSCGGTAAADASSC
jgi:hypothetical protein